MHQVTLIWCLILSFQSSVNTCGVRKGEVFQTQETCYQVGKEINRQAVLAFFESDKEGFLLVDNFCAAPDTKS